MRREARGLRPPATAATAAVALVVLLAVYVAPASRWDQELSILVAFALHV